MFYNILIVVNKKTLWKLGYQSGNKKWIVLNKNILMESHFLISRLLLLSNYISVLSRFFLFSLL